MKFQDLDFLFGARIGVTNQFYISTHHNEEKIAYGPSFVQSGPNGLEIGPEFFLAVKG